MSPPRRRNGPRWATGTAPEKQTDQQAAEHHQITAPGRPSAVDAPQQLTLDDLLLAGRDQAERNADDWWMHTAMQAVRAMARTGREFQAFDVAETYHVPEPDHPNRWGALLTRAAREGLIVATGAAPSRRPATARSLTKTWRGAP